MPGNAGLPACFGEAGAGSVAIEVEMVSMIEKSLGRSEVRRLIPAEQCKVMSKNERMMYSCCVKAEKPTTFVLIINTNEVMHVFKRRA
ncbi:hypothetical protein ACLIIZ_01690 [Azonexus caeni]|jgi:ribosomal protein L19E|uniref:hypothetical protein n=1 Tax=Azonexus caeni TaxID=266126 RepID=UPI003A83EE42